MPTDQVTWKEAESGRLAWEKREMETKAPGMHWIEASHELPSGGWEGEAPEWPLERRRPQGLDKLLDGQRLRLRVVYSEGFPMAPPALMPIHPEPSFEQRFLHTHHLNGDGSICLIRQSSDWTGEGSAADLVQKAAAWFIEWRALELELIEEMSEAGMYVDEALDRKLEEYK